MIGATSAGVACAVALGAFAVLSRGSAANASTGSLSPMLVVTSTTPTNGGTLRVGTPMSVTFNNAMTSLTFPSLSPKVAGFWALTSPTTFTFTPTAAFVPGQAYTLVVPAGPAGMSDVGGHVLATAARIHFHAPAPSVLRLNQLLASLNYLPYSFTPMTHGPATSMAIGPVAGTFALKFPNLPTSVTALWHPSLFTVLTKGAVMNFEYQHGLASDGVASPAVWSALLADVAASKVNPHNWNYVLVTEALPEKLHLYVNGHLQYETLVNTGGAGVATTLGTYPVYLRFTTTTMSGTNPDGSHYHDTGIPWVSYFNGGDALHGFLRPTYGWPQSLGCVEMPYANAGAVWPYTPIGTLVTIQPA